MAKEKKKAKKENQQSTFQQLNSVELTHKKDIQAQSVSAAASEEKSKKLNADEQISNPKKKAKKKKSKKLEEKKLHKQSGTKAVKNNQSVEGKNEDNEKILVASQKEISTLQPAKAVLAKPDKKGVSETIEFYKVLTKLYITLPPCYVNDITSGLNEFLNSYLMKYLDSLNGIVLSHTETKLLQDKGIILYDSPYINFWITTEFLVWRPSVGSRLSGTIQLQSVDHIGLLLHGTFNAVILASDIPKDFYRWVDSSDDTEGEWIDLRTQKPLAKTGILEFYVKR